MLNTHDIIKAVEAEFNRIDTPDKKFHSDHEAWAVLLEEVEKLNSEFNPIKYGIDCLKQKVFLYWNAPSKLKDSTTYMSMLCLQRLKQCKLQR